MGRVLSLSKISKGVQGEEADLESYGDENVGLDVTAKWVWISWTTAKEGAPGLSSQVVQMWGRRK